MDIQEIAEKFGIADIISVSETKTGHTNRTYLVECSSGKYILQSLNRDIFRNPETVMRNIALIERMFTGEENIVIPHYLPCGDRNYTEQDGEIWRMCGYIEQSTPIQYAQIYGYTVGRFLRVVNSGGFEFETPINLHNFGLNLPIRNIHGDTKLDNIIFGEKPAIIDFDTAMRGYICADYGDMIRSFMITNSFSLRSLCYITKGFAEGLDGMITAEETESLYDGIILITSELAERYHEGNRNFPNKTPEQCAESEQKLLLLLSKLDRYKDEAKDLIRQCFE